MFIFILFGHLLRLMKAMLRTELAFHKKKVKSEASRLLMFLLV